MAKSFDEIIMDEGGFKLEFSNCGSKRKRNPNPVNYKKGRIKCRFEGCEKTTPSMMGLCTEHKKEKILHIADWIGRIIPPGYDREKCMTDAPAHSKITEILIKWMDKDNDKMKIMDDFISDLLDGKEFGIVANVPDATTLQNNLDGNVEGEESPHGIVIMIRNIVDRHFPEERYGKTLLDGGNYRKKFLNEIPIRVVVAMLAAAFVCEESNRGDAWYYKKYLNSDKSKYASAYMSSVYYLLRRHTNASETQARMSLKS